VLLGIIAVRNAVLGVAIFRHLSAQVAGKLARSLWQHSVACGLAGELLASRFEIAREEAFTLGLLHDVGKFVLLAEFHRGEAWSIPGLRGRLTLERERELFGMDHAELGAAILSRWRVPSVLHQVVGGHHSDNPDLPPAVRRAIELVRAADALVYSCHLGTENGFDDGKEALTAKVRPEELEGLRGKIFSQLARISEVFGTRVEPGELCAEIVEHANQRLSNELRAAQEQNELLRRAYERSRQQLTSLVQSEKYHALGRISVGVAHEINNPLAFVTANLQTLKSYLNALTNAAKGQRAPEGVSLDEVLTDLPPMMAEVQQGLERMRSVVEALRHFMPSTGKATLAMGSVLECAGHAVQLAAPSRPRGVQVSIGESKVHDTLLDASGLIRAFVEIILNAFAAMPAGGSLSIDFGEDARSVSVFLRDTGEGIPEENIKHLFEPFFTTRPVGAGRGLGLSVAYGIVCRLNGQILIRSTPPMGTVVEVRLPLVSEN
jgi:signal transduction histidine kinase